MIENFVFVRKSLRNGYNSRTYRRSPRNNSPSTSRVGFGLCESAVRNYAICCSCKLWNRIALHCRAAHAYSSQGKLMLLTIPNFFSNAIKLVIDFGKWRSRDCKKSSTTRQLARERFHQVFECHNALSTEFATCLKIHFVWHWTTRKNWYSVNSLSLYFTWILR